MASASDSKSYRARKRSPDGDVVALLRAQVDDLQRRLDASEKRHELRDARDVTRDENNVTLASRVTVAVGELAILAAGFGGSGGSRSGSPSPLKLQENPSKAQSFQDLKGISREDGGAREVIELSVTRDAVTDRHVSVTRDAELAGILDSSNRERETPSETRLRPLPGSLGPDGIERERADQLLRLAALETDPSFSGAAK